ncbi:MAG: hypothetical protein RL338_890 [Chloroflexota bacterium]|jgi:hypothetical protein
MDDERDERERDEATGRSREPCPECGAHRLAVLEFPDAPTLRVQLTSVVLGIEEASATTPPGIGCLQCGAQWRDIDEFRAGRPPLPPEAR